MSNKIRSIEVRPIKQVENLDTELQVAAFVKTSVLQERHIPCREAGPMYVSLPRLP